MNIVNGRKTGDLFGNYTCFKWNGNSVVDYLLTSSSLFQHISLLKVGDFISWLSDHCPIHFTLEMFNEIERSYPKSTMKKAPRKFVWSSISKQKFLNIIKDTEFLNKLESIIELDNTNPENIVKQLSNFLIEAAEKAKIKTLRETGEKKPPWFDKSCRKLKEDIKSLGRAIKRDPKNQFHKIQLGKIM